MSVGGREERKNSRGDAEARGNFSHKGSKGRKGGEEESGRMAERKAE